MPSWNIKVVILPAISAASQDHVFRDFKVMIKFAARAAFKKTTSWDPDPGERRTTARYRRWVGQSSACISVFWRLISRQLDHDLETRGAPWAADF